MDDCFYFLEEKFPNIYYDAQHCEIFLVDEYYEISLICAGMCCEKLVSLIYKDVLNDYEINPRDTQSDKLKKLEYKHIFPKYVLKKLHDIRKYRNWAVHGNKIYDIFNNTRRIHQYLVEICVWFYNSYSGLNLEDRGYHGPVYVSDDSSVDDLFNDFKPVLQEYIKNAADETLDDIKKRTDIVIKSIDDYFKQSMADFKSDIKEMVIDIVNEDDIEKEEPVEQENYLKDYQFNMYNGSFLLNELYKLKDSSSEAVEKEGNLSYFKNYLHVDRSIQEEFIEEAERVCNNDESHLIMLVGSVGDGKSHLLSYLETTNPEMFSKFIIHGDATESFDTKKTDIDTLAEVLYAYDDENFDFLTEKSIVAINVGVLNKFLESDYAKTSYTKLAKIIGDANIIDYEGISQNIIGDKVSFITFGDYNLFELTSDIDSNHVKSDYISQLFLKITDNNPNNPFYHAYLKDKESGLNSPIIHNYEMFCDKSVQDIIISYIIRIFIEYKKIISTRDLLNFIYEFLVPAEIIQYSDYMGVSDYDEYLLPNLLFNGNDRSALISIFTNFDPTLTRCEQLDEFIMDFNVEDKLENIFLKYFDNSKTDLLTNLFIDYSDLKECSNFEKQNIITILIRFSLFYGNSFMRSNFIDDNYVDYLAYLYAYNAGEVSKYQKLYAEVKYAVFNWKGSFIKDYITIDDLRSFNVSKHLRLKPRIISSDNNLEISMNRFKNEIQIGFLVRPNTHLIKLNIDFKLFDELIKINKGYKPNKSERDALVVFDEFVNLLINDLPSNELLIKNLDTKTDFTFEYDEDFDTFLFELRG